MTHSGCFNSPSLALLVTYDRATDPARRAPLSDLASRLIASPPRNARNETNSTTAATAPIPQSTAPLPTPSTSANTLDSNAPAAAVPGDLAAQSQEPDSNYENESDVDIAETLEERRQAYRKDKVIEKAKKKRKDGNELSPEMDDMINAGSGRRCIKCFRTPARLYFGSDHAASDHIQCRDDLPEGSPRCAVKSPPICCELCTPTYFESFAIVDLPKPPPVPHKARIAAYMANAQDMNLRDALHEFRRAATIKKFSRAVLKNSGPGVVMSNEMLQRIVDCAHFYKIESREQLDKETRWAGTTEFGDEVITLIQEHCPKPLAPVESDSTPLAARNDNTVASSATTKVVKPRKCSKCGSSGHIASNKKCLLHPQYQPEQSTTEASNENTDPVVLPPITPSSPNSAPSRPLPRPLYRHPDTLVLTPTVATFSHTPLTANSVFISSALTFTPIPSINWPDHTPAPLLHEFLDTPARRQPHLPIDDASPFPRITRFRDTLDTSHFYGW
ncbi:P-loop containing nucleoside triphosphate hydrolase protein [Mycena venus]|uniref:P-loop containing nucleoside triphosphate hydrolase protein n=1 Tax=Mycena venus TaxID=2733690 RepID=A0A8H6Z2P9_9AGAR|nr:P-loop containing nucleoside triphosphate hydrolase protein [Mycena venus]